MNAATETATKMIEIATAVCAEHARDIIETYRGEPTTWSVKPTVHLSNGEIIFSMERNRVVSKEVSLEMVRSVTLAATTAWAAAGLLPNNRYMPVRVRKGLTWPVGIWHMGVFDVSAYRRGVKVPAEAAMAA